MGRFSTINFDEVLKIISQLNVRSQQAWLKAAMFSLCVRKRYGNLSNHSPAVEAVREIGQYLADPASLVSWADDESKACKDLDDAVTECEAVVKLIKENSLSCVDFELTQNEFLMFLEVCESGLFQQLKGCIDTSVDGKHESSQKVLASGMGGSGVMAFLAAAAGYGNTALTEVGGEAVGADEYHTGDSDDNDYIQSITYSQNVGCLSFMSRGYALDLSIGRDFSIDNLLSKLKNSLPVNECHKSMDEIYHEIRTGEMGVDRTYESWEWRKIYNYYIYECEFVTVVDDKSLKILAKRYSGPDGEFVLVYACKVLTWKVSDEEELLVYRMQEIDCMLEGASGVSYE